MSSATHYLADVLKSLAQPTRLKIVDFLRDGERCVCEIFPAIDEEQSNTSRHLSYMQTHGILSRRKEGVKIYYAVKHPEVFGIIDMATAIVRHEVEVRSGLINGMERSDHLCGGDYPHLLSTGANQTHPFP